MTDRESSATHTAGTALNVYLNEDARALKVLQGMSYGAVGTLGLIGIKSWFSGHHAHGLILFLFGALSLLNLAVYRRTHNERLFRSLFLTVVGSLFLYLTASGGESNTGPLWFYVFPPFVFYLTNLRTGVLMIVGMLLAILVIFRFPQLPFVFATYSGDFQLRFMASVSFVTVFSFVMDYSRRNARSELVNMARLYEKASRTDELTQLPNRRDMHHQLEKEYFRFKRHGHYFSVILMDIDHFKKINDTYGHDAGDFVLVKFAEVLKETCRKLDVAARWGGEEFLLLLPDTSLVQALSLAERLRKKIERLPVRYKRQEISVTTSCGVCSISQTKDLSGLLKQADVNLYSAKLKGRNLVIPLVVQKPDEDP